jgi:hypothetical protein
MRPALQTLQTHELAAFIDQNLSNITDPNGLNDIGLDWRNLVSNTVTEYADLALTKFYDPVANIGLGYSWNEMYDLLKVMEEALTLISVIFGAPFIAGSNTFDPGLLGTYFQSPSEVVANKTDSEIKEDGQRGK